MERKPEDYVNCSVRIRPVIHQDNTASSCLQIISNTPPVIFVLDRQQTYNFDNIFDELCDQETIFNDTVKPLVENVKIGYNCTVFAYGQTGTGKTYTMGTNPHISDATKKGLIPRAIENFFLNNNDETEITISISFIEIYNEKVFDLLECESKGPLSVKGFNVPNMKKKRVFSSLEANYLLEMGNKNRHTAGTKQNSNSSRSHAIFTIYCNKKTADEEILAKLNLVDLAGSESVKKTGNQGNTFHEGVNINKGLLCIGQVMTALSTNSNFIPYRQSMITTILQDSLNKRNFVTLIACINSSPEDSLETVQTLEFAQRVKKMKSKPEINEIISQYKKENPNLFSTKRTGSTPFKRPSGTPLQTTSVKKVRKQLPMSTIIEPNNGNITQCTESPKSLFSMSISTINSDMVNNQSWSPVIKRCVQAMESALVEKIESAIKNTLQRPSRASILRREDEIKNDKENTPKYSWNKIQTEVSKLVKTEIALIKNSAITATSSPINIDELNNGNDKIRRVLNYDNDNIDQCDFKVPDIPRKKLKATKSRITQSISPIDNVTVVEPRRSVRLSIKRARNEESFNSTRDSTFDFSNISTKKVKKTKNNRVATLDETGFADSENISNESIGDFSGIKNLEIKRRSVRIAIKKKVFSPEYMKTQRKNRRHVLKTPQINKIKQSSTIDSPYTAHSKEVLHILNNGNTKDVTKLHLIGPKKAEQIMLFRKLKGDFKTIEDMSLMPGWNERIFDRFLLANFLKKEV